MQKEIEVIFSNILLVCAELDLLGGTHFSLDVERLNQFLQEQKLKVGKSGKVIQGYNAQALVDEKRQIIVHAEAFSSQDHENLAPMMSGAKKNMRTISKGENYFTGKQLSADSNYHS